MSSTAKHGIDRQGVPEGFAELEAQKSNLLLEAQLLRSQNRAETAAAKLAEAAGIEERLSELSLAAGLREKAWLHRFSAVSCWAQAGNFYQALAWCDDLLSQPDLPDLWRRRVQEFAQRVRTRRAQWYAELTLAPAGTEV
jgi:hypothetical protein